MAHRKRRDPREQIGEESESPIRVFAQPLGSSLQDEATFDEMLDAEQPEALDDLAPGRGIFWWGLAAIVLWGLIALAFG